MNLDPLVLLAVAGGSAPLVWQDLRTMSVSQILLAVVFGGWLILGWAQGDVPAKAALSAGVLTLGAAFLLTFPGLGEADVVFIAALAWVMPFWHLLATVALACGLGFWAFFAAMSSTQRRTGPLPFLPSLALAAVVVLTQ